MTIKERKADHIRICRNERVAPGHCYWDDVRFVHNALPEIDADDIDMTCRLFRSELEFPLIVTAITGGFPGAKKINAHIAEACAEMGIGMGIGSERAGVTGSSPESFSVIKDYDVPLVIGNIGAVQLIGQKSGKMFTDEMVQPEGDRNFAGCYDAIRGLARKYPIIVKETGAGISPQVMAKLKGIGIQGADISGMGGTSFAAVEFYRALETEDNIGSNLGNTFFDWGIPAPVSLKSCAGCGLPLIASGGILDGLHAATSIAMGATAAGIANAILKDAMESTQAVIDKLTIIKEELRAAMLLTGSKDLKQLSNARYVILGETKEWMEQI